MYSVSILTMLYDALCEQGLPHLHHLGPGPGRGGLGDDPVYQLAPTAALTIGVQVHLVVTAKIKKHGNYDWIAFLFPIH